VAPGADVDLISLRRRNVSFARARILQGFDWAPSRSHVQHPSDGRSGLPAPEHNRCRAAATRDLRTRISRSNGIVFRRQHGDSSPSNRRGAPRRRRRDRRGASTSYRSSPRRPLPLRLAQVIHTGGGRTLVRLGSDHSGLASTRGPRRLPERRGVNEERERWRTNHRPRRSDWADCSTDTSTYTTRERDRRQHDRSRGVAARGSTRSPPVSRRSSSRPSVRRTAPDPGKQKPAVVLRILFISATDIGISAEKPGRVACSTRSCRSACEAS